MLLRHVHVKRRPSIQCRCIDHREIELLLSRPDAVEQFEGLVDHPFRTRAGTIDLVDDDDRRKPEFQRLQGDEPRLWHRSFDGVDQQQYAVDHSQHALHFAAEIGVAGRVDDVDLCVPETNRAILGEDRDSALAFEIIAVHHALADVLVLGEGAGLDQKLVDERRLAVIDVGDDRDIAQHLGRGCGHGGHWADNHQL